MQFTPLYSVLYCACTDRGQPCTELKHYIVFTGLKIMQCMNNNRVDCTAHQICNAIYHALQCISVHHKVFVEWCQNWKGANAAEGILSPQIQFAPPECQLHRLFHNSLQSGIWIVSERQRVVSGWLGMGSVEYDDGGGIPGSFPPPAGRLPNSAKQHLDCFRETARCLRMVREGWAPWSMMMVVASREASHQQLEGSPNSAKQHLNCFRETARCLRMVKRDGLRGV